jgi:alkylated DNA repair dioxygenase AlkB
LTFARFDLDQQSFVDYDAAWLESVRASSLFAALVAGETWEQRAIVLYGRTILQPRLIAWAGELGYRYSGQTLEPRAWSEPLAALRDEVIAAVGVAFNHALVNRYRDGNDSMGLHSDDEPELGDDPVVAAVSLGAVRRLVFRAKNKPAGRRAPSLVLELAHGSLVVMGGRCQRRFRHGVPKASDSAERVSVTFRRLLREP